VKKYTKYQWKNIVIHAKVLLILQENRVNCTPIGVTPSFLLFFVHQSSLQPHHHQGSEANISTNIGPTRELQVSRLVESTSLSHSNKRLKDWTSGSGDIREKWSVYMGIWQKSLFRKQDASEPVDPALGTSESRYRIRYPDRTTPPVSPQ
jgi:hypothetical protein